MQVFTAETLDFEFEITEKDFNINIDKTIKDEAKKYISMPPITKKQLYTYRNSNNDTINLSY